MTVLTGKNRVRVMWGRSYDSMVRLAGMTDANNHIISVFGLTYG